jgi:hypothetical protein
MFSISICLLAFLFAFLTARRSLATGVGITLVLGYFYGITRANFTDTATHFLFDTAVIGLYAGALTHPFKTADRRKIRRLLPWVAVLFAWPALMLAVPLQDPLIQLVGFRAQVYFLPFLLIGALLTENDLQQLVMWIAALDLIVFGFAVAEYFMGITRFFPLTDATKIIYSSNDVAGGTQYRIPATFVASASYGGVMVLGMPWLVGAWMQRQSGGWRRTLVGVALLAAAVGVFLSASRTQAVILIVLAMVTTFSMKARFSNYVGWAMIVGAALWVVISSPRLQRFTTLRDTSYVETRIKGSANMNFIDAAFAHPLGIGLGAAGTSIPFFLKERLTGDQLVIENEYARIMLEQGLPGLFLWLAFIAWVLTRPPPKRNDPGLLSWRLAYCAAAMFLATGIIGLGLLSWIPGTAELLLLIGWLSVPHRAPVVLRQRVPVSFGPEQFEPAHLMR